MKTRNNVQKTTLRTAAVIFSFVLLSLTVSAQGFWENLVINNTFGEIAEAMVYPKEKSGSIKIGNTVYSEAWYKNAISEVSESELRLENWMFKLNTKNSENDVTTESADFNLTIEKESDKKLKLEEWMLK